MAATKLAGMCRAYRMTFGVSPSFTEGVLEYCKSRGLNPKVNGFQDGHILFVVLLPETHPGCDNELKKDLYREFKTALFHCTSTQLTVPLAV